MEFTLNGNAVSAEPAEETTLLELLRGELGVRSTKDGCAPEGSCGACTVIVDGRAVVSCAQKASRFEGKSIVTHEGLSAGERQRWSECFVAAGASQCGYCSPGIVMKAEAFLQKHPEPSRSEIAHALLGNLCRCTGYVKVIDAIELAAARIRLLAPAAMAQRLGDRLGRTAAAAAGARAGAPDQEDDEDGEDEERDAAPAPELALALSGTTALRPPVLSGRRLDGATI